ncbi:phage tail sheath subtilisin-like domain-containing protein [Bacillus pacificus]|uniref:phage tail sheath N-terminal beta-sandwich domain-containing protein n=1 Tax=Bacillus pacificus TaxID=2026187 RepID=UPI00093681E4
MPKAFKEGRNEIESGVYSFTELVVKGAVNKNARGVLIMPIKADWGKENTVVDLDSLEEAKANFVGQTAHLLELAFKAPIQKLKAVRLATKDAKKASLDLQAIKIEALYTGARGNNFKVTIRPKIGDETAKQLILVENNIELERITFTAIDELVSKTKDSLYITVTKVDGLKTIEDINNVPLTGGVSGEAVKVEDYVNFFALAKDEDFNGICLDGVQDKAVKTMLTQFVQSSRITGKLIVGNTGGEEAKEIDYYAVTNNIQKASIYDKQYTAEEVAVYAAAALISCPLNESMTQKETPFTSVEKLSVTETKRRLSEGNLLFFQEGNTVRFNTAVNTMTTIRNMDEAVGISKEADERAVIRTLQKVKVVAAIDYITSAEEKVFNRFMSKANTQPRRIAAAQAIKDELLEPLAVQEVIELGSFNCYEDPRHTENQGKVVYKDEAFFITEYLVIDAIEKVYNKNKVS